MTAQDATHARAHARASSVRFAMLYAHVFEAYESAPAAGPAFTPQSFASTSAALTAVSRKLLLDEDQARTSPTDA